MKSLVYSKKFNSVRNLCSVFRKTRFFAPEPKFLFFHDIHRKMSVAFIQFTFIQIHGFRLYQTSNFKVI
ncbi:hypothetical protein CW304_07265 [Bacillus sp. UFRGS-B20]|nr:hypothetical protein CW304_07265 [Bacillus sp. UFRGS-B20]